MVLDAEAFGEIADGWAVVRVESFDREQGLVLLGGEAVALGGVLAELQEARIRYRKSDSMR